MKPVSGPDCCIQFEHDGAMLVPGALEATTLKCLQGVLSALEPEKAGTRLRGVPGLGHLISLDGAIGAVAAQKLGVSAKPVRAVLFDKNPASNWKLGWHQDRTIAVEQRADVKGFGPWSQKGGWPHVAPPTNLLERMVTLRVHLDDVGPENAPLLIALGSHRLGRIPIGGIAEVVSKSDIHMCLATAGDVWLYSTPIVHASDAAATPARRRVLQIDYAAFDLPGGLRWLGA